MPGINSGILTNAYPLTAEEVESLEQRVLETGNTIAYLNENKELCFVMTAGVEGIKDLAWNHAYELINENGLLIKRIYRKNSLSTFFLKEILQKNSYNDSWSSIGSSAGLLDESILDEFILE